MTSKGFYIFLILFCFIQFGCKNDIKKQPFPIHIQEKITDCGPTCLKMICEFRDINTSIEQLRKLSSFDKNIGTTFLGLSEAADSLGIVNLAVKIPYEELKSSTLPLIVHWNNTHFIVVYKITNNKVWVADPALGKIEYTKEEFCEQWLYSIGNNNSKEGYALLFF